MPGNPWTSFTVIVLALLWSSSALPEALEKCAKLHDDDARLACFDRLAGRKAPAAVETQTAPPEDKHTNEEENDFGPGDSASRETAEDQFGWANNPVAAKRAAKKTAVPDEISAVIVRIEEAPRGERTVYLDNGQVWRESSRNRRLTLMAGDEVRIKSGLFGAYKLVGADGNRYTRASRID